MATHEMFSGHQTIITAYDMNLSQSIEQTFKLASVSERDGGTSNISHKFCQSSVRDRLAIYFPHDD